jgi:hypothetical protein
VADRGALTGAIVTRRASQRKNRYGNLPMAERTKTEIRNLSARLSFRAAPYDWLKKARALRRASDHLFIRFEEELLAYEESLDSSFELVPPDSSALALLLAFAIENLPKGLYVSTQKIANPRRLKELWVCLGGIRRPLT